jgi:hypothetical protein
MPKLMYGLGKEPRRWKSTRDIDDAAVNNEAGPVPRKAPFNMLGAGSMAATAASASVKRMPEPMNYVRADQEAPIPVSSAQDDVFHDAQPAWQRSISRNVSQPINSLDADDRGSYAASANEVCCHHLH